MVNEMAMPSKSLALPLRISKLKKHYVRGGLFGHRVRVDAINGIDLDVRAGQTLALVGESGSGKSSVARCAAGLEKPDAGEIWIGDQDVYRSSSRDLFFLRELVQLIFQETTTSINPRFTASQAVEEPLLIRGKGAPERKAFAEKCLRNVGLDPESCTRSILKFSGGQRQRIAIARALTLSPRVLILDESLSGLDLSTQAQIANLLLRLQKEQSLTYLLVSHDLSLVARMADVIAVMAEGRIVETGPAKQILSSPKHQATVRLVDAARTAHDNLAVAAGDKA